jgi:hypothetical protein
MIIIISIILIILILWIFFSQQISWDKNPGEYVQIIGKQLWKNIT